jgi:hypothetical protein
MCCGGLMINRATISANAAELGVSWHTVSTIAIRSAAALASGPERLAGVELIGVDEHRWAPRRIGTGGFVRLIIDLTPTHEHSGPARLLGMVPRRSPAPLASWLSAQPSGFAQAVEILFLSDHPDELHAAVTAGWAMHGVVRAGEPNSPRPLHHWTIHSLKSTLDNPDNVGTLSGHSQQVIQAPFLLGCQPSSGICSPGIGAPARQRH